MNTIKYFSSTETNNLQNKPKQNMGDLQILSL